MIALIGAHPHTFWLTLGGLLLAAEMLGGAGFLLWSGVAAVITGLISWFIPEAWAWQGGLFAVLTVLSALLWWRWLHRRQTHDNSGLNQRNQQLIGQCFRLETPIINGRGHIRIADGSWPIRASEDLPAGTTIQVLTVEGITLRVARYPQNSDH